MARPILVLILSLSIAEMASAQALGTFRWQLQPYCNVVTLSVSQTGGVYTLDGYDDQCGAATRASVTGTAFPNPDGTVGIGLNVVAAPGGTPLHVEVPLNVTTMSGTWRDSAGASGTFAFNPSHVTGSPRPTLATMFPAGLVVGSTTLSPDGALLAEGTETPGPQPPFSRRTRMLWDPGKGAFRAGGMFQDTDDDNMGLFSVAMGWGATASGRFSVALGTAAASADRAVALGGAGAHGERAVALGFLAFAGGRDSVAIGSEATAHSANSVALGNQAHTEFFTGSFVYSDGGSRVSASANQQFTVRARGGTRFFSNLFMTAGVTLAPGASAWASVSDVNMKENFRDLDGEDVLAKIARMPIREWNYKAQDAAIRHVGPTAQDFHGAFGLGEDPLRISTIDADGIALRAVQALEARTRGADDALARENAALEEELAALKAELSALRDALQRLEGRPR